MNFYLLFKSLHLISVISWMAGLLYLPRIFVYHSEAKDDSQREVFKAMERKLYNFIMMPAMILSWIFGFILILTIGIDIFFTLLSDSLSVTFISIGMLSSLSLERSFFIFMNSSKFSKSNLELMGKNGRNIVKEKFEKKDHLPRVLDFYNSK